MKAIVCAPLGHVADSWRWPRGAYARHTGTQFRPSAIIGVTVAIGRVTDGGNLGQGCRAIGYVEGQQHVASNGERLANRRRHGDWAKRPKSWCDEGQGAHRADLRLHSGCSRSQRPHLPDHPVVCLRPDPIGGG